MPDLTLTRGDTFLEVLAWTPEDGPATLEHVTVASRIVDARGVPHDLSVTKALDYLSASFQGDSTGWAAGEGRWDVYTKNADNVTKHTKLYSVGVNQGVTPPPP